MVDLNLKPPTDLPERDLIKNYERDYEVLGPDAPLPEPWAVTEETYYVWRSWQGYTDIELEHHMRRGYRMSNSKTLLPPLPPEERYAKLFEYRYGNSIKKYSSLSIITVVLGFILVLWDDTQKEKYEESLQEFNTQLKEIQETKSETDVQNFLISQGVTKPEEITDKLKVKHKDHAFLFNFTFGRVVEAGTDYSQVELSEEEAAQIQIWINEGVLIEKIKTGELENCNNPLVEAELMRQLGVLLAENEEIQKSVSSTNSESAEQQVKNIASKSDVA